jgi:predicted acetyltransferase
MSALNLRFNLSNFEYRAATVSDRPAIQRMLELYQHDLSDIWDQDLDEHGHFGYALDRYWSDPGCHPFVATTEGKYVGFALVDQAVRLGQAGYWMDQFFVLKKYRRFGAGKQLAFHVFSALPGAWEVGQMAQNQTAHAFWHKVIRCYTNGAFVEQDVVLGHWHGTIQSFESHEAQWSEAA